MRKLFCYLLLSSCLLMNQDLPAQTVKGKVSQKILQGDSTIEKLQKIKDSVTVNPPQKEMIEIRDNSQEGLVRLMKEQEKRRKKEKTMAYLRMGIGLFFLVILIIGLMRKQKKKTVV